MSVLQPASSLATEKPVPCGSSNTSSRSCDTSIPPKHCSIILASLPCCSGLGPWQLCGNGRNDWSTKLIRGLVTEAATGFQSRRGPGREPTPVIPHYAPFRTYKTAGRSRGGHWSGGLAPCCASATIEQSGADRLPLD